ncbi:MAG: retroviral-like aspartic protease family protein [Candidatus Rokubacteria bacterium]|nr:retroviral-like aspartic protease family protein [Candidatus Rokubacteria bacterium]
MAVTTGTFRVPIEVGAPRGERWEPVEALVDTGASYTLLPASLLDRLGVTRVRRWPFELADGHTTEYDIGYALVRYDGESVPTIVVFGREDVAPILGAYTLEGLRLAPDPVRRRLIPVPGLLMAHATARLVYRQRPR